MDNAPIINGTVSAIGVFVPNNKDLMRKALDAFRGKPVELILRKPRSQRSSQQNRYYWGVVVKMIAKELGDQPENVHRILAGMFLRHIDIISYKGKLLEIPTVLSTAELGKDDFFDAYVDRCRQWASEFFGLVIPDPQLVDLSQYH